MPSLSDSVSGTCHRSLPPTMPAESIKMRTDISTAAMPPTDRVAATKQNRGTITLRYAPQEPKPELPGTGT